MLRKPGFSVQYALQRAAHAAETAARCTSPEERGNWLAIERGWLKLAASYDLSERLGIFIKKQDRKPREHEAAANCITLVIRAHEEALWPRGVHASG